MFRLVKDFVAHKWLYKNLLPKCLANNDKIVCNEWTDQDNNFTGYRFNGFFF